MKKPFAAPAPVSAADRANDDIGETTRLRLFRTQFELREAEQRAFDLFLQNLVKGTSHLSLGQEAIAAGFAVAMKPGDLSFCTYRGHAHTLARGVPVEQVLGELMQRDNGLMRGKGGSMHLTSVEHGVMGSYAIVGAHLPIACGTALRAQYKGQDDVSFSDTYHPFSSQTTSPFSARIAFLRGSGTEQTRRSSLTTEVVPCWSCRGKIRNR